LLAIMLHLLAFMILGLGIQQAWALPAGAEWLRAEAGDQGKRRALVIGNSAFRHIDKVPEAEADAELVARAAQRLGFETLLARNLDRRAMDEALNVFLHGMGAGSEVFVYYAGQAVSSAGTNYLLPVDVPALTAGWARQLRTEAFNLADIITDLNGTSPRLVLMALDANHRNPFAGDAPAGLARMEVPKKNLVIVAAAPGQIGNALLRRSNDDAASLFTRSLVGLMPKEGLELNDLLRNLRDDMRQAATAAAVRVQEPQMYGEAEAPFYFLPPSRPVPRSYRDCPACPEMVSLPTGTYTMGETAQDEAAENVPAGQRGFAGPRAVAISRKFSIGKYEVTRGEYRAFVAATGHVPAIGCDIPGLKFVLMRSWLNPGFLQDDREPVVCLSWFDAEAYAEWLSRETGRRYRLPSEAEWEYAARAGTTARRYWGTDRASACRYANVADLSSLGDDAAKTAQTSDAYFACKDTYRHTAPVGQFAANAFGLHDMLGNVAEWVADCWFDLPQGATQEARVAPGCEHRVVRGGDFTRGPPYIGASTRFLYWPNRNFSATGFRVVRDD
jgi:formylglycine-generating enzyme required for sulfatase activity